MGTPRRDTSIIRDTDRYGPVASSMALLSTPPPHVVDEPNCGSYNHCMTSTRFLQLMAMMMLHGSEACSPRTEYAWKRRFFIGVLIIGRGTRFTVGDIVSIVDVSNESYYAQIRGLAVDHTGDSCCVLTWLVPTTESISDTFEPENYVIGLEEDVLRDISCCNLVCHCPADYFRPIASPYSIHSY
ncbi:GATA zinc finger domain-containing protein 1 [Clonorchis sinensis]|uniref:GATA zinc finger domain-containing protein 1 n=1 Tax=Clonorchis sinensis TaxID=79923 RepID=A0A419PW91_CLOSI|nr:GATA zinc finger domain-containing protein 1 [Clonorchis sinensis]